MRHKTIAVIVLLASLFGTATLQAQTEQDGWISGRVYDEKTLEPVVGAYILVPGMGHIDISDKDGNFLITKLKPGEYNLEISTLEYSTVRIERIIILADSVTVISQHLSKKTTLPDTVLIEYYERKDIRAKQVGRISGHLFDKETLKPVVGASISIVGTILGAISDFDGNFHIVAQLRAGEYSLRISSLGYMMVTIDHVIVLADSATEITQYLLKDTTRLENIITIEQERAYRHDMTISQVTISETYIKAHPVSTIDELLELVSGQVRNDWSLTYEQVLQAFLNVEQFQEYLLNDQGNAPDSIIIADDEVRGSTREPNVTKFGKPVRFIEERVADSAKIGRYYWVIDYVPDDSTARMQLRDPTRKLLLSAFFVLVDGKWTASSTDVQDD